MSSFVFPSGTIWMIHQAGPFVPRSADQDRDSQVCSRCGTELLPRQDRRPLVTGTRIAIPWTPEPLGELSVESPTLVRRIGLRGIDSTRTLGCWAIEESFPEDRA